MCIIPCGNDLVNRRFRCWQGNASPFFKNGKGVIEVKTGTASSILIQLTIAVGVLVLLWQVVHQMLPDADLLPYVIISLLSILAYMAKSRFK